MSFTEPLSVTLSGTASSLPRTGVEEHAGTYTSADGTIQVTASHVYGKRVRRMLRLDIKKIAPDPFRDGESQEVSMSVYIVFDTPSDGFTVAELLAAWGAFKGLTTASSDALITKLAGGEF